MSNEHGYHGNTENRLARLRCIEGQVRGLQRMISQGEYRIDILFDAVFQPCSPRSIWSR